MIWLHKERDLEIVRRREAGEDYDILAREYRVSRDRIQQIIRRTKWIAVNGERPGGPGPSSWQLHIDHKERDAKIIADHAAGVSYARIGKEHGICAERVRAIWHRHLRRKAGALRAINP